MTKIDLINFVSKANETFTKTALTTIITSVFEGMRYNIFKDRKFSYPGFGTFIVRHRKARKGRDPRTKVEIQIKASKTVGFRPAKAFKIKL